MGKLVSIKETQMRNKTRLIVGLVNASLLVLASPSFATMHHHKASYKGEGAFVEAPMKSPKMLMDGLYAGIGVGYDSYKATRNTATTLGGVFISSNPPLSSRGVMGNLFLGYGQYFNEIAYLAAEIFVDQSGASMTTTGSNSAVPSVYTSKFSVGTSWGVSLLPGLKMNDSTLFYVRLGYLSARLRAQEYLTAGAAGASASASQTNWQGAFNWGVGMESDICQNFSARGEYTFSSFNSFNTSLGTKWTPYNSEYVLSLIYHFDVRA